MTDVELDEGNSKMTQLLQEAIAQMQKLPISEQDAIASITLEELADEQRWQEAFAGSQKQLAALAAKVRQDIREGRVKNVGIDEFVVMPNHVHGIIVIGGPDRLPQLRKRGEIRRIAALSEVHPRPGSLGAVVGPLKSAVSRWCRSQQLVFGWEARFHDRIIRGRNSLKAVREYIRDNPKNWDKDSEFVPEE